MSLKLLNYFYASTYNACLAFDGQDGNALQLEKIGATNLICCVQLRKKKTLQKPCTNNLAERGIQKDRDQSKQIKLKTLQSRRLLLGLIKQREIELSCDTAKLPPIPG